ncbi:MAG: hypothetical protein K5695_16800 [Oscillospiraceae bacterium]|nr:hypothetical protein [Oscillospiraceae bacterium]
MKLSRLTAAMLAMAMLTPMTTSLPANAATDAWRTAYQQLLNANKTTSTDELSAIKYSLADILGDGIPELMISDSGAHISKVKVYTYYHGKTVELGTLGDSGYMRIDMTNNELLYGYTSMGYFYEERYIYRCGALELTQKFLDSEGAESSPYYKINDQNVSRSQYTAIRNELESHKFVSYGRDYLTTNLTPLNNYKVTGTLATLGDLNNDSKANASDAAKILIGASGIGASGKTGLTGAQEDAADVNGDHLLNASDAAVVLIYAAAVGAGQDVKLTDLIK